MYSVDLLYILPLPLASPPFFRQVLKREFADRKRRGEAAVSHMSAACSACIERSAERLPVSTSSAALAVLWQVFTERQLMDLHAYLKEEAAWQPSTCQNSAELGRTGDEMRKAGRPCLPEGILRLIPAAALRLRALPVTSTGP